VSWGRISTDPPWWGPDGILPYLRPSELLVYSYMTATLGGLREPRAVTIEEIHENTLLGREVIAKAVRTLLAMGIFTAETGRDKETGHFYRRFLIGQPNPAEVIRYLETRRARAQRKRDAARERAANLHQGPPPTLSGLAVPDGISNGRPRCQQESGPDGICKPVPDGIGTVGEVGKEGEGGEPGGSTDSGSPLKTDDDNDQEKVTPGEWGQFVGALKSGLTGRRASRTTEPSEVPL